MIFEVRIDGKRLLQFFVKSAIETWKTMFLESTLAGWLTCICAVAVDGRLVHNLTDVSTIMTDERSEGNGIKKR